MTTRGSHHIMAEIESDLRAYSPLVAKLPEPEAVYIGHPADDRDYPISVTITVITDQPTLHRGVIGRGYRIQITVKANRDWREWFDTRPDQPASLAEMAEIMHLVGQRLNRAKSVTGGEIPLTTEGGPSPLELDGGRLAISNDWRMAGWYLDDDS